MKPVYQWGQDIDVFYEFKDKCTFYITLVAAMLYDMSVTLDQAITRVGGGGGGGWLEGGEVKISRDAPLEIQNGTQQHLNKMIDLLNLGGKKIVYILKMVGWIKW